MVDGANAEHKILPSPHRTKQNDNVIQANDFNGKNLPAMILQLQPRAKKEEYESRIEIVKSILNDRDDSALQLVPVRATRIPGAMNCYRYLWCGQNLKSISFIVQSVMMSFNIHICIMAEDFHAPTHDVDLAHQSLKD